MTDLHQTAFSVPDAHGTVVVVHGLGEHSGRYAHVVEALNRARWSAVTYDHHGHGRSPGKRGAVPHPTALLDDLAQILDGIQAKKRVLFGHSMGGAIAARFVAEELRPVDALILSSPALKRPLTLIERIKLAIGSLVAPNFALANAVHAERLSHDPAVVQAYLSDPLVHHLITARLARFILESGAIVRARAKTWRVPTLLLWAAEDQVVDPVGSRELAWNAPEAVITAKEFPGLYHEIFNEGDSSVFDAMTAWLERVQ